MNNDKNYANPFNIVPCSTPDFEGGDAPKSVEGTPERKAFQTAQLTVGRAAVSMAELTDSFASSMISAPPSNTLVRNKKSVRTDSPAFVRNLDVEMSPVEESRNAESARRPGAAILTSHSSFKKLFVKEDSDDESNNKTNKQLNNNQRLRN